MHRARHGPEDYSSQRGLRPEGFRNRGGEGAGRRNRRESGRVSGSEGVTPPSGELERFVAVSTCERERAVGRDRKVRNVAGILYPS